MVQDDEDCDDGEPTPACTAICTFAVCGDSIVTSGEECDDGGESSVCDADCTPASCGDNTHNTSAGDPCSCADGTSPVVDYFCI